MTGLLTAIPDCKRRDNETYRGRLLPVIGMMLLIVLLGTGCAAEPTNQTLPASVVGAVLENLPSDMGIATSQEVIESRPFLVDVRDTREFATGFIEGAVNIPLRELAHSLELLPELDEEIVVVCCSGPRSTIAMTALRTMGFSRVRVLAGGMAAWRSAMLPVVGGPAPRQETGIEHAIDPDLLAAVEHYLSQDSSDDWGMVNIQDLKQQLDDGSVLVLDVRQPSELSEGRIENSLHIPLRELEHGLELIPRDRPVTVVDASGHRSTIAMAALRMMGYPGVSSLTGGMMLWQAVGGDSQYHAMTEKIEAVMADPSVNWGLVSPPDLAATGSFLVDLRSPDAYRSGFVEGAVNIPLRELTDNLDVLTDLDQPIVLISDSSTESAIGMMTLRLLGYQQVSSLAGGMEAWAEAGLELSTEPVPLSRGEVPDVDEAASLALDFYLDQGLPDDYGLVDVPGLEEALDPDLPVATTVIDVRGPNEFAPDAIESAVNLPLEVFLEGLASIPAEPLRTS